MKKLLNNLEITIGNRTGSPISYTLRKNIVAYIELTGSEAGYRLHLALNDSRHNDERFEALELVLKEHLLRLPSLKHMNLFEVVKKSETEEFTDSLADLFSVAFAKTLTVSMVNHGYDLKIDIIGHGYNSTITILEEDIPKWAFLKKID